MLNAIRYNLTHLVDFKGRDARQTFWYYVLFLVVIQFVVGIIAAIPMYISMFTQAFEAASQGIDQSAVSNMMVDEMIGLMQTQMMISVVIGVVMCGLFAASFVRRLHDAGFTGWIAAGTLAIYIASLIHTITIFDRLEEVMRQSIPGPDGAPAMDPFAMQAEMGVMGLLGWVPLIIVIIFGVMKSNDGPNKYGDSPVSF
jgi:uncharacterized membrane protein YhaH (DUF805 family)